MSSTYVEISRSIPATLVKSIDYRKDGKRIVLGFGTQILIDLFTNVGFINGDHIDVLEHEYKIDTHYTN
jgi:hypothetical protein